MNISTMMITYSELFEEVQSYFLCEALDDVSYFENAKMSAKKNIGITKSYGQEALIDLGYFSEFEFILFAHEKSKITGGIPTSIVEIFVKKMIDCNLIIPAPIAVSNAIKPRYKANLDLVKFLYKRDAIANKIGGWQYISNKFKNSVLKIIHTDSVGDISIGTGFHYAFGNETKGISIVVTNKHVVQNATRLQILSENDTVIQHSEVITDPTRDLAYFLLPELLNLPVIHLVVEKMILKEIITIGYPSIPMTKHAYQICHKGEINSYVENYYNAKLFLFSAKTSSGNSGSPIIDENGFAVGIVSEELFEEEAFKTKGKLAYSAGIPSEEIIKSLNEYVVYRIHQNTTNPQE